MLISSNYVFREIMSNKQYVDKFAAPLLAEFEKMKKRLVDELDVNENGVFETEMAHKNMTYPHNTSNERARRVDHGHLSFVTQNGILGTKIVL